MASTSDGDGFYIYKFRSSGLVALCQEVTAFVAGGGLDEFHLDPESARYIMTNSEHRIRFQYLDDPGSLPDGSIMALGHPSNGVTIRKSHVDHVWRYTHAPYDPVSYDDLHKSPTTIVFNPKDS